MVQVIPFQRKAFSYGMGSFFGVIPSGLHERMTLPSVIGTNLKLDFSLTNHLYMNIPIANGVDVGQPH